jgi:hypothetical protein
MRARSFFKAMACAAAFAGMIALAQAQATKLDPSGTWTWTSPGRNGGPARTNTLVLKFSAGAVTGAIKTPGREGNITSTDISDGKLEGDQITFKTTRERNGTTYVSTYSGTLTADTMKGKMVTTGGTQDRSRNWLAKRSPSGS